MDIRKLKRELNGEKLPTYKDCDFCDWLIMWGPFCSDCVDNYNEEICSNDHPHCSHIIKQKGSYDIMKFKDNVCNDYLNSMDGPLGKNYKDSNYNHCYNDSRSIKKISPTISHTKNKYRSAKDESSRNYTQGQDKKSIKKGI